MGQWLKEETEVFSNSMLSMVGLIATIFASGNPSLLILGQPFDMGISLCLLLLCAFFRIKCHLLEPRLSNFYNQRDKNMRPAEKSVDELQGSLFLYFGHILCMSIIHFYLFLGALLIFLIIDQWCNASYYKYQKNSNLNWGRGFSPEAVFKKWIWINCINIALILAVILLIKLTSISFNLLAYSFVFIIFIVNVVIDWVWLNKRFYIDYFGQRE